MLFRSILFDGLETNADNPEPDGRDVFADLRLEQVIATILVGREAYDLGSFFHTRLGHVDTIAYRHEVFRDLDGEELLAFVRTFAESMRAVRVRIGNAQKTLYRYDQERWFLDGAHIFCEAVSRLTDALTRSKLRSRGFRNLRDYLRTYTASDPFVALLADAKKVQADLDGLRYMLRIAGPRVTVSRFEPEQDYSADVLQTFERFRQGAVKGRQFRFSGWYDMNHVEAEILDRVARLHPDVFASLTEFRDRHREFLDETISRFDREVQFYVAYLEHIERFRQVGLHFCYPDVTNDSKEIYGREVFDLALAWILVGENTTVVTNEFHLTDPERILVVSGPNQGGKTTFARAVGQLHHLAGIGCLVPGTEARLYLVDRIFAHFEREEDLQNLSGKLEDDLRRIHRILELATPDSLIVMNESFGSTTLKDALYLNREILRRIIRHDLLCVSVTFLDELATLSETTVSMVSTVDPDDPEVRTFKIVRRPADGLAYAWAIAKKHRLTFEAVRERIAR